MVWAGSNLGRSWTRLSPAQRAVAARSNNAAILCSLRLMALPLRKSPETAPLTHFIHTDIRRSVRRLPGDHLFHGNFRSIERARNLQHVPTTGITRLTISALSRARRCDRQVGVSPEAERPVHQRQLLPAIKPEVLEQDTAVLQAKRAFSRGPARNAGVHGAVLNTRVYVPPAELHPVQMKLAAAGQLSQKLVVAHAFGFHLQS